MGLIFLIVFFLLLSAFFSGSEIAFISASKLGVAVKQEEGDKRSAMISRFYDRPKQFLGTMLVGNNIALIAFTLFASQFTSQYLFPNFSDGPALLLLNTLLTTVVVLLFGEFLPKTLARLFANKFIYAMAYPLSFFKSILSIPTNLMTLLSNMLLKYVFRAPLDKIEKELTRSDLQHFIDSNLSEEDTTVDKEILTNALTLNQQKVRDIMIPRTEVVVIDQHATPEETLTLFQSSKHSRIVVIDGDIENVVGYIHHQQLFEQPKKIKNIKLEIPFVPEAMNLKDLMLEFIRDNVNIACVVDEFGGMVGILTLEDILEEIFGEIEDEYDEGVFIEEQISDHEYLFSGRLEIDYINEKYEHLEIPEGEYQTLSGYIVMTSGTIPKSGAEIVFDNYTFILEQVSDTKIETIRVIKKEDENVEL